MSRNSKLGYDAEHAVEAWFRSHISPDVYRPRAGTIYDTGDIRGLPFVVSVKNHADLRLADWVGDLAAMCQNAKLSTGVVIHKRRGRGSVDDWYVTTSGALALPLLVSYVDGGAA